MAVYTHLAAEDLAELIAAYDVGDLVSAKGIAEGISNSNWLIETTAGRFVLTMYERRIDLSELPFFLGLLDHLSERGCAVPATIHDRSGAALREVVGKAIALIEFLPGISVDRPTTGQAHAVGEALARMHLASADYPKRRANPLDIAHTAQSLAACGSEALAAIDATLPGTMALAAELHVTRDRLLTWELRLQESGALDRARIDSFVPTSEAAALFAAQRDQFIANVLDPVTRREPA